MPDHDPTPRPTDDPATAEAKSRSVDERIPQREPTDLVPEVQLPGAFAANVPQTGLAPEGPLDGGDLGPGEAVLRQEQKAQRAPIQRG